MLAFEEIVASGGAAAKTFGFLHGILGRGANWRSVARRFVQACPDHRALLVDLRHHGDSTGVPGPNTLETAATDLGKLPRRFDGLLGHSFGGKVALRYAASQPVEELWLVDSNPGPRLDRRGSEVVGLVLTALRSVPHVVSRREDFVRALLAQGLRDGVARWLAMSLRREGEAFCYGVDLDAIDALLDSYFAADLWPVLERIEAQVHIVVATRSEVFGAGDHRRARQIAARRSNVFVHEVDAGHWIHVEAPGRLLELLASCRGGSSS